MNGYRFLATPLHSTADAAIEWFQKQWGIKRNSIEIEEPVRPDIDFRPTFKAQTHDFHMLCVEVAESIYNNSLDSFALACLTHALPVQLYVAVPKDIQDQDYPKKLKSAQRAGVGIIEVDGSSGRVIQSAVSFSIGALRPVVVTDFPAKYRQSVQQAEQTFRSGQPVKACSLIYDELESACRRLAARCEKAKLWKRGKLNIDKAPWAMLMESLQTLNRNDARSKPVTKALINRVSGVTEMRNDSGHKPHNQRTLIKRDLELRTRFEGAVDLLRDFVEAGKKLKI
jgi:hypothetical protein